jgi:hypothetical protein
VRAFAFAPALPRRGLALGVCLALAVPTTLGTRPRLAEAAVVAPAEDPALAEARALYDEGKARFDTFDYEGAADLWTKAYAKLPEDSSGVRNAMVYNIATAQEKSYELDKDVQHLRQAVLLLEQYVKNYKVLFAKTPETKAEVDKAEARIAALKERIARAERGEDTTLPPPVGPTEPTDPATPPPSDPHYGAGTVDGIVWTTGHNPPPDQALVDKNMKLAEAEKKTDRMLIASYVMLSVSGLFLLVGAGSVYGGTRVDDPPASDPTADPDAGKGLKGTGYGALAIGFASLVTGATLLGVGLDRRKKARNGTLVAGTPVVGPGFAGVSLRVRF